MKINRKFYSRPTLEVAKDLIGKFLIHKAGDKLHEGQIIETEAYAGFNDLACHGSRGITERNRVMFGPSGYAYVYIIYGIHHCLNLVTEKENYPSAVLVRALNYPNANGPGKLCREFQIRKATHNGMDLINGNLWVEDRDINLKIAKGTRIGINYAGECATWSWRFFAERAQNQSAKT